MDEEDYRTVRLRPESARVLRAVATASGVPISRLPARLVELLGGVDAAAAAILQARADGLRRKGAGQ